MTVIDEPSGAIEYEEHSGASRDAATVVMVPGSCSTGAAWRPVIQALGGHYRCVTTSLLGYGATAERRSRLDASICHEAAIVETFTAQKLGAILVSPLSREGSVPALRRAHEAGIRVVTYNNTLAADFVAFAIASDQRSLGATSGRAARAFIDSRFGGKARVALLKYLDQLRELTRHVGAPLITGKTQTAERERLYDAFRRGTLRILIVSKVGMPILGLPFFEFVAFRRA